MPPPRRVRPASEFDLSDTVDDLGGAWREAWSPARQAQSAMFAAALLLLVVSTMFGGASQGNALSLMAVELASLPLLFLALYLVLAGAAPRGAVVPLVLLAAIVALPLLQLIPLPASLWSGLPGRGPALKVLDLTRQGHIALPFSVTPEQTWRMAMGLVAPAAMFLGTLFLDERERRVMAVAWLALAMLSLTIGAAQMLGGETSPLYFYAITNAGFPVGVFSNRNHQAEFLLCLIPFAAVFAAEFGGSFERRRALGPLLAVLYVLLALVGVAVTRSRAGIVLSAFALVGAAAVVLHGGGFARRWRGAIGIGVVGLTAIGAVLVFSFAPLAERFDNGGDPRFEGWPIAKAAATSFMPLGSGLGSFDPVFRSFEPLAHVSPFYFNHAHNDYLELWLETGIVGPAILLAFLAWFGVRALGTWRHGGDLAAACTLLMTLIMAHSAVDFPIRTEAIAVLFAFACAVLATDRPAAAEPEPAVRP